MTYEEFVEWVWALVQRERLTSEQAEDLSRQRQLFDEARERVEQDFAGHVAGFVNEELLVTGNITAMLDKAFDQYHGERQVYFEQIAGPTGPPG